MRAEDNQNQNELMMADSNIGMPVGYDNPFSAGRGMLPPNIPIPDSAPHMMNVLLDDSNVDEDLREEFYWVFGKDNTLTFLDDERKISKIMAFDILKIDSLNATPYYDFDFGKELRWNVMRNIFETKLDRARGIDNSNQKNERTVEQSQFSESRQITQNDLMETNRDGFLKRLLSKR